MDSAQAARIYIASSKTRNPFYQPLVARMRAVPYRVHDWSDPPFRWEDIDRNYQSWTIARHVAELRDPASPARLHYQAYCKAIVQCDVFALLLPAGTDARQAGDRLLCRWSPAARTHPLPVLAVHRERRRTHGRGSRGAHRPRVLLPAEPITPQYRGKCRELTSCVSTRST